MIYDLDKVNSDDLIESRIISNNDLVSLLDVEDNYLVNISLNSENTYNPKINILENIHQRQQQILKNDISNNFSNDSFVNSQINGIKQNRDQTIETVIYDAPSNNQISLNNNYANVESNSENITSVNSSVDVNKSDNICKDTENNGSNSADQKPKQVFSSGNRINDLFDEISNLIYSFDLSTIVKPIQNSVDLTKFDVMHD